MRRRVRRRGGEGGEGGGEGGRWKEVLTLVQNYIDYSKRQEESEQRFDFPL